MVVHITSRRAAPTALAAEALHALAHDNRLAANQLAASRADSANICIDGQGGVVRWCTTDSLQIDETDRWAASVSS